jgi:predicted hydrocarbon binding protein
MPASEGHETIERQKKKEFPFHYSADKRIVHVVAKLSDEPGALASLLNALGTRLNLIGTTSYTIEGGYAISSNFGEALFDSDTPKSIHKVASRSPHVLACQVWESRDGLLVDQFHQGIQLDTGGSYVMMHRAGLAKAFGELTKLLGSGGETILYTQGKSYGHSRVENYRKMFGLNPTARLQELSHIYESLGFGAAQVTIESSGKIRFVLTDDFECSTNERSGYGCSFIRGLIEGSVEIITRKEMTSEELKCRLQGDKNCEFVLSESDGQSPRAGLIEA